MIKKTTIPAVLLISGLSIAMMAQPAEANSWFWGSDYFGHQHKHFKRSKYSKRHKRYNNYSHGNLVLALPHGVLTIAVGGLKYHYHDGIYYRRGSRGYTIVPAPIGACVRRLPYGHGKVYVKGRKYYVYQGVYYKRVPEGYLVVEEPARVIETVKVYESFAPTPTVTSDSFIINIPNGKGGYTPVTLTRSGGGFIGPQGEYYSSFPRVEQLKLMYGTS